MRREPRPGSRASAARARREAAQRRSSSAAGASQARAEAEVEHAPADGMREGQEGGARRSAAQPGDARLMRRTARQTRRSSARMTRALCALRTWSWPSRCRAPWISRRATSSSSAAPSRARLARRRLERRSRRRRAARRADPRAPPRSSENDEHVGRPRRPAVALRSAPRSPRRRRARSRARRRAARARAGSARARRAQQRAVDAGQPGARGPAEPDRHAPAELGPEPRFAPSLERAAARVVGADDRLHQRVAHDVALGELA